MPIGQILEKNVMLVHIGIGEAGLDGEAGSRFKLATSTNGTPLLRDMVTGKWFSLCWRDIIKLGIEAGISEEDTDGNPSSD